jgi:hypothetical protein
MTTTVKPTFTEAMSVIDNNYSRYMDGLYIDPLALDIIAYSVGNNVEVRDYLMGIGIINKADGLGYINRLIELGITEQYRHAFYSVLSAVHYSLGDRDLSQLALNESLALVPNYSLSNLLNRVIGSGWPFESFTAMAQELHPKVIVSLNEYGDTPIPLVA